MADENHFSNKQSLKGKVYRRKIIRWLWICTVNGSVQADRKATDRIATDQKATDRKATDRKATDQKATDRKTTDRKATDRKYPK